MAIMLTCSTKASGQKTFDWEPVISAIAKVESGGNPKAFNKNGNCGGLLQITPVLVKECNNILKNRKSTKRYTMSDRFNAEKSKEMFILIQETYNPSHNIEKAIRMWNGGPNGHKMRATMGYYKKVMKHYKKKGDE